MTIPVTDSNHINKVYALGGTEKLVFDQIIDTICRVLGKAKLKIYVPMRLMRHGAALAESILPKPPITRDQFLMLEEDNITDNNALESVFNIKPVRLEEGIREYLSSQ